jgi:hypothetical protein
MPRDLLYLALRRLLERWLVRQLGRPMDVRFPPVADIQQPTPLSNFISTDLDGCM